MIDQYHDEYLNRWNDEEHLHIPSHRWSDSLILFFCSVWSCVFQRLSLNVSLIWHVERGKSVFSSSLFCSSGISCYKHDTCTSTANCVKDTNKVTCTNAETFCLVKRNASTVKFDCRQYESVGLESRSFLRHGHARVWWVQLDEVSPRSRRSCLLLSFSS